MFFSGINYWAVIAAAAAGFIVGYIWYSPWAFGRLWMKSRGMTRESMEKDGQNRSMALSFPVMVIFTVVTALVLSALFHSLIVTSIGGMLLVAVSLWAGFSVPIKLGDYLFGRESLSSLLISVGHELVAIAVMAIITGIWS